VNRAEPTPRPRVLGLAAMSARYQCRVVGRGPLNAGSDRAQVAREFEELTPVGYRVVRAFPGGDTDDGPAGCGAGHVDDAVCERAGAQFGGVELGESGGAVLVAPDDLADHGVVAQGFGDEACAGGDVVLACQADVDGHEVVPFVEGSGSMSRAARARAALRSTEASPTEAIVACPLESMRTWDAVAATCWSGHWG
jgi:hypothetical protein